MNHRKTSLFSIALSLIFLTIGFTANAEETDKVIGTINGEPITQNEFLAYIRLTAPNSNLQDEKVQQQLLQAYVGRELLYQDALEKKLDQSEVVKKIINEQRHSIISKALASEILKSQPITNEQLRAIYDKQIEAIVTNEETGGEPKELPSFEQVSGRITQSLQDRIISEYIGNLFKKAKIEIK